MQKQPTKQKKLSGRVFDALPDAEKERIFQELERETPEQRRARWKAPSSAADRALLNRLKKKVGRPKIGKGCKVVAVSVEADLLKQADAYAKRLGLGRTELFTQALRGFLPTRTAS
jgi:ribosome-binding factor A